MQRPTRFVRDEPNSFEGHNKRGICRPLLGFLQPVSNHLQACCWSIDHVLPHQSRYSIYTASVEKWTEILDLAQRWVFKEVEQLCIRELQKLSIPPVEKIHIYQAFRIDRSLLAESFAKLTLRPETLNLEEGNKLGIETALQIAQARELSRGSNSGTKASTVQLSDAELRSVIQNAFGLEEEAFFDFAVGDSFNFMRVLLTDIFCLSFFEDGIQSPRE